MNRRIVVSLALGALCVLTAGTALAQGYPDRPIKLVVPYAPGGSADIAGRLITDEWARALGGTLVIENKAGAGGNLGVDMVAKAAPDGYTIGLQTVSLAINPALTAKMPYDTLKDLAPIGQVNMSFPVLSAAQQQVQSGKLRALRVTGPKRSALMPDVPTIAEAGLPNYSFETWFMVFAPATTPRPVIDKLNTALNQALNAPALEERMLKEGFYPIPSTPAQARGRLEQEMPVWAKLIKEREISAE